MGNKTLIYKQKLEDNLTESYRHLEVLNIAFIQLAINYNIPFDNINFKNILYNSQDLGYSDQIIYRFSKLQDSIGAKLFKSLLLYQGENTNRPFLDILNELERMEIIDVDEWFEIRDLRNEIAHDYNHSDDIAINILNSIYKLKDELKDILNTIQNIIK